MLNNLFPFADLCLDGLSRLKGIEEKQWRVMSDQ